ncbi:MAG: rhomboid family intramembrane serine protease [Actinobacteria bacterium]|nr:rhomboid family intramembrane serine protease [Actinomycetota bacterium]
MTTPASGPTDEVPTCVRHPDRETYVSCSRCGRPACPDCLRSAPVGQQCVDCIRGRSPEAGPRVRPPRTAFGGRVTTGAAVTWSLVGINVLLYIAVLARPSIADNLEMVGYAGNGQGSAIGVGAGQWYRLLTSAFVAPSGGTFGFADILFNMWALIVVGPQLEHLLGRARFLAVYLLSAIGGGVFLYYLVAPNQAALGASGAVFGLFGAWFVVSRKLRVDSRGIIGLIAINLVLGFVVHGIAWQDHIGGLVTGALITAAYAYAPKTNRFLVQAAATVVVLAALVAATALWSIHLGLPAF